MRGVTVLWELLRDELEMNGHEQQQVLKMGRASGHIHAEGFFAVWVIRFLPGLRKTTLPGIARKREGYDASAHYFTAPGVAKPWPVSTSHTGGRQP